jgi:hypothetical protein
MTRLSPVLGTLVVALSAATQGAAQQAATATDLFLWLESVDSPRALAWVKAEHGQDARRRLVIQLIFERGGSRSLDRH